MKETDKAANGINMGCEIGYGAIAIQRSEDGVNWTDYAEPVVDFVNAYPNGAYAGKGVDRAQNSF